MVSVKRIINNHVFCEFQFDFPFVQTFRVTRFRFSPIGDDDAGENLSPDQTNRKRSKTSLETSSWNCDGEPVDHPALEYRFVGFNFIHYYRL